MTTEQQHFCKEHNVAFTKFEKEGREWYSHKNDDGTWHKEQPPKPTVDATKKPFTGGGKSDPARTESIELQHYTDNVKDLWIAGKLKDDNPLVMRYLAVLKTKLGLTPALTVQPVPKPAAPMKQAIKDVEGIPDDWIN